MVDILRTTIFPLLLNTLSPLKQLLVQYLRSKTILKETKARSSLACCLLMSAMTLRNVVLVLRRCLLYSSSFLSRNSSRICIVVGVPEWLSGMTRNHVGSARAEGSVVAEDDMCSRVFDLIILLLLLGVQL
ncbi:hypothetical protein VNO77_04669 [Canavalia gladiata]|uniref:Uncharacterized protein n=1 Tax=Canavalia gladiata TaxID=3824 RepID=A0AAN9RDF3_CANGL